MPLLNMLELLECLEEQGMLVAVMPHPPRSPRLPLWKGVDVDVSCPAPDSPSSLTSRANHTASASPNSLWVLGRGLITGGLLLGEFLGGEEEEALGLNEDVC